MNNGNHSIEDLHELFKNLKANDPGIDIENGMVKMVPCYWNFSFIMNFVGIFFILLLISPPDANFEFLSVIFYCIGLPFSIYDIFNQLKFYNKIFIDTNEKSIRIVPDSIMAFFVKGKIIPFQLIKNIDYFEFGYIAQHNKYVLTITIPDNIKPILLIFSTNEENAKKIKEALLKII